jgi:hypothetical protein
LSLFKRTNYTATNLYNVLFDSQKSLFWEVPALNQHVLNY